MKRILLIATGLIVLLVGAVIIAAFAVDPEALREPIARQTSTALGRDVSFGAIGWRIFPLPAIELGDVSVTGHTPDAPPFAKVERVAVSISPLPLLFGRVVARSVEVDHPVLIVPFDAEGAPIVPGRSRPADQKPRASAPPAQTEPGSEPPDDAGGMALAVDRFFLRDVDATVGPWHIVDGQVSGRLALDRTAKLEISAEVEGLGHIRETEVVVEGLGSEQLSVRATGELGADLAAATKALGAELDVLGQASGDFAVGREGDAWSGRVVIDVPALDYRDGATEISGPVQLRAELGGEWAVVLSAAVVSSPGFHKPAGTTLEATGALGANPGPEALGAATVRLGELELQLLFALAAVEPSIALLPQRIDLAELAPFITADIPALEGGIRVDALKARPGPLRIAGTLALDAVSAELENGTVKASGVIFARGRRFDFEKLELRAGEERITLSGGYALGGEGLHLDAATTDADLGALIRLARGESDLEGLFASQSRLSLSGGLDSLTGSGRFAIRDGRIRGFSLARQVLGPLSELPAIVATARGIDLSKYDREEFEELSADYRVGNGVVQTDNLTLRYRHATAYLRGSIGLEDGALDLSGRVVIAKEVDAELAGAQRGRERIIPIAGVSGTVSRPRVHIDRATLAQLAATYATGGELRDKLEDALGPGGADAVEDLLEGILGGGRSK